MQRSEQDNYILLDETYLLLHAADEILLNSSTLFGLALGCNDPESRKEAVTTLDLLSTALSKSARNLQWLISADRASWDP